MQAIKGHILSQGAIAVTPKVARRLLHGYHSHLGYLSDAYTGPASIASNIAGKRTNNGFILVSPNPIQ
jgi:hypothetical protein